VAIQRYAGRELQDSGQVLSKAAQRVREGKVVDAVWGLGTEPLKNSEANAAKLVQESSVLKAAGAIAASAYGGPAGAAAYAAWYTYHETGDINLALRVGVLTGATSAAFGGVAKMPTGPAGQIIKKAIVGGAIGGLAGERGAFMTSVSKVPGMNAMALFHDQWAISWQMGDAASVSTIVPATVLTYVGSGAPVYEKIHTTFVDSSGAPRPSNTPSKQETAKPKAAPATKPTP